MSDHQTEALALAELDRLGRGAATALRTAVQALPEASHPAGAGPVVGVVEPAPASRPVVTLNGATAPGRMGLPAAQAHAGGGVGVVSGGGTPRWPGEKAGPGDPIGRPARRRGRWVAVAAMALAALAVGALVARSGDQDRLSVADDGQGRAPAQTAPPPPAGPAPDATPLPELGEGEVVVAEADHGGTPWRLVVDRDGLLWFESPRFGREGALTVDNPQATRLIAAGTTAPMGPDDEVAVFALTTVGDEVVVQLADEPAVTMTRYPVEGSDRSAMVAFVPRSWAGTDPGPEATVVARAADGTELAWAPVPQWHAQSEDVVEGHRAACVAGSMPACDLLWYATPVGSELEAFAQTCGGRDPSGSHLGDCEATFG